MTPAGFPHSDIPGSQLGCQLPRAYRRLLRPSSALDAKASTMCPSQLATTNTTPHPPTIRSRHDAPAAGKESDHESLTAAHYKDARVHYADLKQQPHQPPDTKLALDAGQRRAIGSARRNRTPTQRGNPAAPIQSMRLMPQDPTVRHHPDPGPAPPGSTPTTEAAGSTEGTRPQSRVFIDDSTSEHHHAGQTLADRARACAP